VLFFASGVVVAGFCLNLDAKFDHRLGPNIIRVLPSTCVTFLVYENTKIYLPSLFDGPDETTTYTKQQK